VFDSGKKIEEKTTPSSRRKLKSCEAKKKMDRKMIATTIAQIRMINKKNMTQS
jgi:hypothetical protein